MYNGHILYSLNIDIYNLFLSSVALLVSAFIIITFSFYILWLDVNADVLLQSVCIFFHILFQFHPLFFVSFVVLPQI